ncbi:gp121 [Bacillus phage G]|uniref:Gp121 n=1 Tax=Bacillus phage G TaxID=2884420 RepID=G3MBI3_9CAUD|nr:gp121 [Bacillus phage G]AEO93383.1 gp121 [Bacillus phage G]
MLSDTKQMYSFIKMRGFKQSKDVLGTYFDKGDHKLTINKQAGWFICYYNRKSGMSWQLIAKSQTLDNFSSALGWVVQEIQKNQL